MLERISRAIRPAETRPSVSGRQHEAAPVVRAGRRKPAEDEGEDQDEDAARASRPASTRRHRRGPSRRNRRRCSGEAAATMPSGTPISSAQSEAGHAELHGGGEAVARSVRSPAGGSGSRCRDRRSARWPTKRRYWTTSGSSRPISVWSSREPLGGDRAALGARQHQLGGIARQDVHDHEDDQRDQPEDRQELEDSAEDIATHDSPAQEDGRKAAGPRVGSAVRPR